MLEFGKTTLDLDEPALRYDFDGFQLDTERRELRSGARIVPVEPQVLDFLICLIRHRDRVVSKDDLIDAVWGGRIVSESTLSTRLNAARSAVGDSGDAQRLIKTLIGKGLRFVGDVTEVEIWANTTKTALALPEKPSVAVLPFQNLSGDPQQDYFADGMVEEIITALSRVRSLFVIARNSSFVYKGKAVDIRQVGRELGVRYVLEGSVRKAGDRVRIAGQLIDSADGGHIWADRFDGALADVFELQDRCAASVVNAIAPRLVDVEIQRARGKPTEHLGAYDHYLRGLPELYRWERGANGAALRSFRNALRLDPEYAAPYAAATLCYVQRKANNWLEDVASETTEALRLATQAAELGKDDAECLAYAGATLAFFEGQVNRGAGLIARSLAANPNFAAGWHYSGWVHIWLAQPETAIQHLQNAIRLNPRDPLIFNIQAALAHAYFFAGRYSESEASANAALAERPGFGNALRMLAASAACDGRAKDAAAAMIRLRQALPDLRVSNLRHMLGPYDAANLARYEDALRRAGLPE